MARASRCFVSALFNTTVPQLGKHPTYLCNLPVSRLEVCLTRPASPLVSQLSQGSKELWLSPSVSALRKLRQEDVYGFKISPSYTVGSRRRFFLQNKSLFMLVVAYTFNLINSGGKNRLAFSFVGHPRLHTRFRAI